jgi:ribosomal RNA-processing protein 8
MTNVPLEDNTLDIAIFCLSLMGTNFFDYLKEAFRVLKVG